MAGTRAVIAAAAVLLAGPTLAGCSGGDPVPKVEPSSSGSSPAASSGSPSPSQVALSPEETVRAWVKAQNDAMATGDTSALENLSADHCRTCDQFIDPITTVYQAGGWFKTRGWSVDGTHQRHGSGRLRIVDAALTFASGTTLRHRGEEPVRYGSEKHLLVFRLRRAQSDGWRVVFVGFLS
jgi:hypothetical protein